MKASYIPHHRERPTLIYEIMVVVDNIENASALNTDTTIGLQFVYLLLKNDRLMWRITIIAGSLASH